METVHQDPIHMTKADQPANYSLRVCLDGGFRRGREGKVYFSFLNYGHFLKIELTT